MPLKGRLEQVEEGEILTWLYTQPGQDPIETEMKVVKFVEGKDDVERPLEDFGAAGVEEAFALFFGRGDENIVEFCVIDLSESFEPI